MLRSTYGWTDIEIVAHVDQFGFMWLLDAVRKIQEDKQQERIFQYNLAPLHQTPQTKEGARSLKQQAKNLLRQIQDLTPWRYGRRGTAQPTKRETKAASRKQGGPQYTLVDAATRERIGSGNTAVILSAGEMGNLELYKDAEVLQE